MSLENIKVGDRVLVTSRWSKAIKEVTKITPKGAIRVSNGSLYDNTGCEKSSDVWDRSSIVLLTDELEESFNRENIIRTTLKLMNDTRKISYEQAIKIKEILEENK